VTIDLHMSLAY